MKLNASWNHKKSNPNRTWKTTSNPGNHWWASPWLPFYSKPCPWIDTWIYDAWRWLPDKFSSTTEPHWKPNPGRKNCESHRTKVANAKINAFRWRKYPKIIQGDKVLMKRSSKTNKFVSQFDPTPHITDVQGSRYELVADNDYYNMHTIFRHINDIKLYKPYQHSQRYHPYPHPVQTQISPPKQ